MSSGNCNFEPGSWANKMKRRFLTIVLTFMFLFSGVNIFSQCAMCERNAETSLESGNTQAKGLNSGIMYLMVMPYLLVGGIGYYWYAQKKKAGQENEEYQSEDLP
jgi:hypothetical protein